MKLNYFDDFIKKRSLQSLILTRMSLWWRELSYIQSIVFVGSITLFCTGIASLAGAAILGASIGLFSSFLFSTVMNYISEEIEELKESTKVLHERLVSSEVEIRKAHTEQIEPALIAIKETNQLAIDFKNKVDGMADSISRTARQVQQSRRETEHYSCQLEECETDLAEIEHFLASSGDTHFSLGSVSH